MHVKFINIIKSFDIVRAIIILYTSLRFYSEKKFVS